jgi:hypothetical protein
MIWTDFRTLGALLATLLHPRRLFRRHTLLMVPLVVGLFLIVQTLWLTQVLDHVLFPRRMRHRGPAPVFIVSNPRSGTTLLHRLMATDRERFVTMALWHTMVPSITGIRFIQVLARLDAAVGGPLRWLLHRVERASFGGWDGVHNMGFERTEEDEAMFYATATTASLGLTWPTPPVIERLALVDELPDAWRRRLMAAYRDRTERFLSTQQPGATYLCKNVFASGRVRSLAETWPDARFIYIVRDPMEALPSFCKMFIMPWRIVSPDIPADSDEARMFARIGVAFYRHLHRAQQALGSDRMQTVRYEDLVRDPVGTVTGIYARWGWPVTPALRAALEEAATLRQGYESRHTYSLEEFGLDPATLRAELGEVCEAWGFDTAPGDAA